MKKPKNYKLKKWLCENSIVGLKLYYYQTGTDTTRTDWELEAQSGEKERVVAETIKPLVNVLPDWVRVLNVKDSVKEEVKAWDDFADKESVDLAEYERLKAKFENT